MRKRTLDAGYDSFLLSLSFRCSSLELRFRNIREENNYECKSKNTHSNEESRINVSNLSLLSNLADKITCKNRNDCSSQRVA